MSRFLCCAVVLAFFFGASPLRAQEPARRGDLVLKASFDQPALPAPWLVQGTGSASVLEGALAFVSKDPQQGQIVKIPLPVERLRGTRITLSARVKAQDVATPPKPWNGVKLMLHSVAPDGPRYESPQEIRGTFDWRTLAVSMAIPADATEAWVFLGIEATTGRAWFDDVKTTVTAVPRKVPATRPALPPPEQLDRRTDVPRLRGVMYGPFGKEEDLRKLAEWNGNLIRWQFYWYEGSFAEHRTDMAKYDRWLERVMAEVDRALPVCNELGIRVVIDLHTPPGGSMGSGQGPLFEQQVNQEKFVEVWDKLAAHYKDQPAVWGYDLLNEPAEGLVGEGLMDWRALSEKVARRVRAIDPHKAIIVEPGPFGGWANLAFFEPIDVPGIVYSVHMYDPIRFTHQGVLDGFSEQFAYPGVVENQHWDKAALKKLLEPVRQYQLDYGVPIYVGEYSAIRWAPGESAANYLRDCVEIFEEYGWDHSYHAFREWHGWNVELGPDRKDEKTPSPALTERQRVLMDVFSKNVRKPAR